MSKIPKKILITGGSGFIGTNLVEYYTSIGDKVLNIDINSPRNAAHINYWQQIDILDKNVIKKAILEFQPDFIFHMASRTDLNGMSIADYRTNTEGVENIITAIKELSSLKRIIFASSMLVCKIGYKPKNELDYCPTTFYGESKILGEKIVRTQMDFQTSWTIIRPTSIWGPWFDIPYKNFFTMVERGLYFHPKGKVIKRSFGFIGNSIFQLNHLLEADKTLLHGKTFYLADYPPIEIKIWADLIQEKLKSIKIKEVPIGLLKIGAKVGDILKVVGVSNPPLTSFRLNNLLTEVIYDLAPLESICGDLPYTLEEGVTKTVEWLKKKA